jgi:hypothetical protein
VAGWSFDLDLLGLVLVEDDGDCLLVVCRFLSLCVGWATPFCSLGSVVSCGVLFRGVAFVVGSAIGADVARSVFMSQF